MIANKQRQCRRSFPLALPYRPYRPLAQRYVHESETFISLQFFFRSPDCREIKGDVLCPRVQLNVHHGQCQYHLPSVRWTH
jgi:hypothetical protein